MDRELGLDKIPFSNRQDFVADALRSDIVSGVFKPGSRMPTHLQLVERFGVSALTVQHAMNQLIRDGFLHAKPRKGTFVVPAPPHLCHYAVTFHTQPSEPSWPHFWLALSREAMAMHQESSRELSIFYGIHGWAQGRDFPKLIDLVRRHQVAGLIFTSDPHTLVDTPLLTEPGIPRVALTPAPRHDGISTVGLGFESLVSKVAAALPPRPRRVAMLTTPTFPHEAFRSRLCEVAPQAEIRPDWTMAVRLEEAAWARNAAFQMMQAERRRRPDAVIITDDNLVPHATAGIAASNARVPEDMTVITVCSFPWPTHSAVPARRVGYDVREILRTCIDIIDAQRAGRAVPQSLEVEAISEEEASPPAEAGAGAETASPVGAGPAPIAAASGEGRVRNL